MQLIATIILTLKGCTKHFANLFRFSFDYGTCMALTRLGEMSVYRLAPASTPLTCPVRYSHYRDKREQKQ